MKIKQIAGLLISVLMLSGIGAGYINVSVSQNPGSNILISYFSRVENTDFPDDIDTVTSASLLKDGGKLYGNTQYVATMIQQHTGGDLFLIQTEEKYPSVYEQIDAQGGEEHRNGVRPKLEGHVDNMDDYSVIFLGYPIWHGQAPRIISAFLERYDFSGKTIVPFCTSHSSGSGSSDTNLHDLAPDASWLSGRRFAGGYFQKCDGRMACRPRPAVTGLLGGIFAPGQRHPRAGTE